MADHQAPVADAGSDQVAALNSGVTLDGSGSFDPDDGPNPLNFEWLQIGGPDVFLDDATTATPTFTPMITGEYIFSLVVRDGQADSAPDGVKITVTPSGTLEIETYLPVILK